MRPLLPPITILLLLFVLLPACAAQDEVRPLRQEIRVRLVPERHLLAGETTLEIAASARGTLPLSFNPAAVVEGVAADGKDTPFHREVGRLAVEVPPSRGGKAVRVTVRYHCVFNDPAPARPVATEDPSYGVSGAITPHGTYLGGDAGWYPAPESLPPTRRVIVTAPAGIEAITAGRRLFRKTEGDVTTSAWEEDHPAPGLSLSAGPYVVTERSLDGLPLYAYFSRENAPLADRYLEATAGYLRFYADRFGPYPFEKFAVVENFFPTGYGFPSYTLIGGTVIRLPFIASTSLPHEIAHCWWGNGVRVDYREGNWSEGLVTYLADHLLEERKSAREGRDYRFRLLADYASLVGPGEDFPLRRFVGRVDPASRAIGYGKGAMVFHMVRQRIGEEAFFGAMRELFRRKRFATAAWSDFAAAFSAASGKDMASFMAPWLDLPGGPRLSLSGVTRERAEDGWRVTGRLRREGESYLLAVPVAVEAAGMRHRRLVEVQGGETAFVLKVPGAPERVLLDPEVDTFRVLSPAELPDTVNRIKGSRSLAVVAARDCAASRETLRLLLRSIGQGDAPILREGEVSASLAEKDLLVCGLAARGDLVPVLPPGVVVQGGRFSVGEERYAGPGEALFAVGRSQGDPARTAALFFPLSPEAAEACVLKITHYGRYGVLVFDNGENRRKETLPPASGGSVMEF